MKLPQRLGATLKRRKCHGVLLVLGLVAACAPALPAKTLFIAARETTSNELLVGTFETVYGEPTSAITLFGVGDKTECRGITGVGGIDRVAPGTTTRLMMKCEDGRFIQGALTYERVDRGAGLAEDTGDGFYQLVFGHLKLSEESLRQEFALLPPPPARPAPIERIPAALPPDQAPAEDTGETPTTPPAVPQADVDVDVDAVPDEDDDDDPFAGVLSDDDEDETLAAEDCERGVVEGECLDDFDLEEFDSEDVENFLRDEDDPGDEIET